ncbi:hypothetical protein BS17DRAFT_790884 [Gyrodon lividus]|nr:hypothetical protein BS17DRAFT_790884 [Gyrodon lividus]
MPKVPVEKYFPEYTGGADVNKAAKCFLWSFMQTNRARLYISTVSVLIYQYVFPPRSSSPDPHGKPSSRYLYGSPCHLLASFSHVAY